MLDWIKKIAGYAPDIAAAVATGGSSLAVTGLRILGKELLGNESASESEIERAVLSASPEQMVELTRCNNEFKVEMKRLENQDKQSEHVTTQETIRNGDNSQHWWVSATRPAQSWCCMGIAAWLAYNDKPVEIVLAFLGITGAYFGLRQLGKWKTTDALSKVGVK